ncbi:DUF4307 domain-containing protein [Streptomyces sp. SID3343]|uniref:DUF4307 domain-containing protein n=1 Tax=Streptomyces sp. SID3343 TaxID=2690260 RepID=UPI00136E649A|nr:DUF4307 domain-containing protein [Streptomyces sp. SID3343]
MSATPATRYGKGATRNDRGLKIAFAVFLVLLVSATIWIGLDVANPGVRGSIPSFEVTSDSSVEAQIEVRKDADKEAVCVLRSRDKDGIEVGRRELRFDKGEKKIDRTETLQTAGKPNTAELEDCHTV